MLQEGSGDGVEDKGESNQQGNDGVRPGRSSDTTSLPQMAMVTLCNLSNSLVHSITVVVTYNIGIEKKK